VKRVIKIAISRGKLVGRGWSLPWAKSNGGAPIYGSISCQPWKFCV